MKLTKKLITGINWSTLSFIINGVLQLGVIALLAKRLPPEEIGFISIYMILVNFFTMISEFGLGSALVQKKDIHIHYFTTVLITNLLIGAVFSILMFFLSVKINYIFFSDSYETFIKGIRILSINIFFVSILQVYRSYLFKYLNFKFLSVVEVISGIFYTAAVVVFVFLLEYACIGVVFAIILRRMLEIILMLKKINIPLNIKTYRLKYLQNIMSFGLNVTGDRFITFMANQIVINMILGKSFGPGILGQYNLAQQLLMDPQRKLSAIISKVTFPTFSYYQDKLNVLKNGYLDVIKYLSYLILPINLLAFFLGPEIIEFIYGAKYEYLSLIIRILAISGSIRFITTHTGPMIYAIGKAHIGLIFNIINLLLTVIVLYYFKKFGFINMIIAWVILSIIISLSMQIITNQQLYISYKEFTQNLYYPIIGAVIIFITIMVCKFILPLFEIEGVYKTVLTLFSGLILFIVFIIKYDIRLRELFKKVIAKIT